MKTWLSRFNLSGQFILLLVVTVLTSQILNILFLMGDRKLSIRTDRYSMLIDDVTEAAKNLPPYTLEDLPLLVSRLSNARGSIFLSDENLARLSWNPEEVPSYQKKLSESLSEALGRNIDATLINRRVGRGQNLRPPLPRAKTTDRRPGNRPGNGGRPPPPGKLEAIASAEVSPGVWLNAMHPHNEDATFTLGAFAATGITLLVAILAALVLTRRLVRPIQDLTSAARRFGRGVNAQRVPVSGPHDIQVAIKAFNGMQENLERLIDTQRSTLRAVGHDLRTPITALRIRAEDIPPENGRDKFIATLDDLTVMTEEILRWAKDVSSVEDMAPVDLTALMSSISDDYSDQKKDVSFREFEEVIILNCRRVALRRAIVNLIDNALKYAGNARLSINLISEGYVDINVDDFGPGIPEEKLEAVIAPFTRVETSRNRNTGGIGLGLSIVQSVALGHGGSLKLENLTPGFRATLHLPITDQ